MDEIAFAMKSCFAGLYLDGFDFIQGLDLGFHLNEVKISSLPCNDFIQLTEKERTFRIEPICSLFSVDMFFYGRANPSPTNDMCVLFKILLVKSAELNCFGNM